jgi:hypothetical protein
MLQTWRRIAYVDLMDDLRPLPAPPGWTEALNRAEADVAAGDVVDGAEIHAELAASIERMKRGKPQTRSSRRKR